MFPRISHVAWLAPALVWCLATGCRVPPIGSLGRTTGNVQLRVVHLDPAEILQLTISPLSQSMVVDVAMDPDAVFPSRRIKLRVRYWSSQSAPFLRSTAGGVVLDEAVLRPGALLRLRVQDTKEIRCPAPRVPADERYIDQETGGRFDHLPCYEVEASHLSLDHDATIGLKRKREPGVSNESSVP
jgi:hypothetical protein